MPYKDRESDHAKEVIKKYHEKPYSRYISYKRNAKNTNKVFDIEYDFFESTIKNNCHYCGCSGKIGLDRVDNNIGYIKTNVIPCCKICNIMKKAYTYEYFVSHIKKIYNNTMANT